ncbi:condensation domain-containing protein (plasmid) [Streptomyces sp. NBC_01267]|uniref:condensation domain-containing protein n=1 Tax=Streptomyces sp. NBC_01267 TaxID=2903805 RepID=UPI002E2F2B7E|nr:condensation domain-containing protein [Streptomyces sp. NBC_01267]
MTTDQRIAEVSLTAVLDLGDATPDGPATLELRGPLDPSVLRTALARIASGSPAPRGEQPRLRRHGPGHHTLECSGRYPLGALADLLTAAHPPPGAPERERSDRELADQERSDRELPTRERPDRELPELFEPTPLQREMLAESASCPAPQVGQLFWRWHGPLDTGRFTAAWQAVFDCETVLRAAFVRDPEPRVAVYPRSSPDVVRHRHGTVTRQALMERERLRGFDLSRPGMLRAALLDGEPQEGYVPPTDVLLTYHRGLLDSWSVRLLLQEFYRAYVDSGTLRGGERRPDLRDYRRWLSAQGQGPAGEVFARRAEATAAALPRAPAGAVTRRHGTGRTGARLNRTEAARLARWSVRRGATESVVLQAVWAMLLYRAAGRVRGPAEVNFSVLVSGRGITMEGIARVPGPFGNPLPMTVEVDPRRTVPELLRDVRDRALDIAACEWVSAGQLRAAAAGPLNGPETLLSFEHRLRPLEDLGADLAAQGIQVTDPDPAAPQTGFPIGVVAYYDSTGGLVLSSVHDRGRLDDDGVAALLAHSARLLRELPLGAGDVSTIAEVLSGLAGDEVPRLYDAVAGQLVCLRPAREPGAGTVCLVGPSGPGDGHDDRHDELVGCYPGPQALAVLRGHPDQAGAALCPSVGSPVGPLMDPPAGSPAGSPAGTTGPLVLGAFSGSGALACELARSLASHYGRPPLVVLGTEGTAGDGVADFARHLAAAAERSGREGLAARK